MPDVISAGMPFIHPDFLLPDTLSQRLYHQYAERQPIIDYHCHLSPEKIEADYRFRSITEIWLEGDHYKWRAMRANGVPEVSITGSASDRQKFDAWAATVPYTLRNPLYHWTHMELANSFGIYDLLDEKSAQSIYEQTNAQLATTWTAKSILQNFRVEVVCTTDDPADDLQAHLAYKASGASALKLLPTLRPDKAMAFASPGYLDYVAKLGLAAGVSIASLDDLLEALKRRHNYFHTAGGRLSDHGLEAIPAFDSSINLDQAFAEVLAGKPISQASQQAIAAEILYQVGRWNAAAGWTMQLHLGAIRNNNTRMLSTLGADCGVDSIGDFPQARTLAAFLDRLDKEDTLPRTILYNLNPADNELMATMIGNFNDGSIPGKIQYGSGWWFLDQKDGMERQIYALSNMGLLSRFIGMLTDSRSFLSYPRHDYFRRILCRMFAKDVQEGLLPNDEAWLGKIISNICYHNARNYFNFN